MSDPHPPTTATLIKRVRHVAAWLEAEEARLRRDGASDERCAVYRSRAQTLTDAAARLDGEEG
jgi:hypothetical protein